MGCAVQASNCCVPGTADAVTEEMDESALETILVIRKDSYFEKVTTDYPQTDRPHQIEQDFNKLRGVLVGLRDAQNLQQLGQAFTGLARYEKALAVLDDALS